MQTTYKYLGGAKVFLRSSASLPLDTVRNALVYGRTREISVL